MSRIQSVFTELAAQGKKALIPFVTAGDPSPALTVPLMHRLVDAGASIIELGVPFSDPMADGPVIQKASERALANGVGMREVLGFVREFRKTNNHTPVVLMGYLNPVERMGYSAFAAAAADAGVDGVLTVDAPPEEGEALWTAFKQAGLDPIFLLAPTTPQERVENVTRYASGFIYYVSLKGVTGAKHLDLSGVASKLPEIRQKSGLPVGVGFGIRDAETAAAVGRIADAVVIGSRIVQEIEANPTEGAIESIYQLLHGIRQALDAVSNEEKA